MSRAGRALGCSSRTLDREAWMGRGSSDLWGHGGGRLAALAGAGQPRAAVQGHGRVGAPGACADG